MKKEGIKEIFSEFKKLLHNKYFYLGAIILLVGELANFLAQNYLYKYYLSGKNFPVLSDFLFNIIPYYNLTLFYNFLVIISLFVFLIYVVSKKKYNEIPFYLAIFGLFYIVRGIFVILNPYANPPEFIGVSKIFDISSRVQMGLYPSGHTGSAILYLLFAKGPYRLIFFIFATIIILGLLISRAHYSIDIFSGIIFAYALYSFGKSYLKNFIKND